MPRIVPSIFVEVLDRLFPWAADQEENEKRAVGQGNSSAVEALIHLYESIPQELIVLDQREFADLQVCLATLRNHLRIWESSDKTLYSVQGFPHFNPITVIRRALHKCPDAYPSSQVSQLTFLDNEELRTSLGQDLGSIQQALSQGEWKSATVLAGSIVEALLLWKLLKYENSKRAKSIQVLQDEGKFERAPSSDPTKWKAHEYIRVVAKLGGITMNTETQALLAKDFRNFIHPGAEMRLQQKCDRATTYSALAAVEHVVRDLSKSV